VGTDHLYPYQRTHRAEAAKNAAARPEYLLKVETGQLYIATPALRAKPGLVPVKINKDGSIPGYNDLPQSAVENTELENLKMAYPVYDTTTYEGAKAALDLQVYEWCHRGFDPKYDFSKKKPIWSGFDHGSNDFTSYPWKVRGVVDPGDVWKGQEPIYMQRDQLAQGIQPIEHSYDSEQLKEMQKYIDEKIRSNMMLPEGLGMAAQRPSGGRENAYKAYSEMVAKYSARQETANIRARMDRMQCLMENPIIRFDDVNPQARKISDEKNS